MVWPGLGDELPYHNGVNVRVALYGSAPPTITVVTGHKKELSNGRGDEAHITESCVSCSIEHYAVQNVVPLYM